MRRWLREFFAGVRIVGSGFGMWRSSPRLMAWGLLPGIIVGAVFAAAFVAIAVWVDDWSRGIATGVTHDSTPNGLLVAIIALAIIGGGVLLAVFTFTALTLLIGQPFFEHIAEAVAESIGLATTAQEEPWWRSTCRGVREVAGLLLFGAAVAVSLFLVGLIPVVGAAAAFVIAAVVGGALLAFELTSYPLARVGVYSLRDRRRLVRAQRPLALGFGVAAYLICLIPLGAVAAMPGLVAGGTLLAARVTPQQLP